jgi:hypothetical protein
MQGMGKQIGWRAIAVSMALAALLLATGCGGGDSASADGPSGAHKSAFAEKADAICRKADKAQETGRKKYLKQNPGANSTRKGREEMVVAAFLPPLYPEGSEFAALHPPAKYKGRMKNFIEAFVLGVAAVEAEPGIVLGSGPDPFAKAGRLATNLGFDDCSDPA